MFYWQPKELDAFAQQLNDPAVEIVDPAYFRTKRQAERLKAIEGTRKANAGRANGYGWMCGIGPAATLPPARRLAVWLIKSTDVWVTLANCRSRNLRRQLDLWYFMHRRRSIRLYTKRYRLRHSRKNALSKTKPGHSNFAGFKSKEHPIHGGIIGVDRRGNITMQFNSGGMARAAADSTGLRVIEAGK